MNFIEYQMRCRDTAQYPQDFQVQGLIYTILGLTGESGEIANKFKKVLRGDHGYELKTLPDDVVESIKDELGDVLWYCSEISTQLNCSLADIAEANISKLAFRQFHGKIKGEGDNR